MSEKIMDIDEDLDSLDERLSDLYEQAEQIDKEIRVLEKLINKGKELKLQQQGLRRKNENNRNIK